MSTKKLTVKDANKLLEKYGKKIKDASSREFHIAHSRNLANTTTALVAKKKKVDMQVLKIASLVHDIGYSIDKKDHPKHSVEILEKEGYVIEGKLRDCIMNHSASASPKTTEGKIFQLADKVDIFNPNILSIIFKYNDKKIKKEDIDFLKLMTEKSAILLSKYTLS